MANLCRESQLCLSLCTRGLTGLCQTNNSKNSTGPPLKHSSSDWSTKDVCPFCFAREAYNTRLEYLTELPKGSCFWIFDRTDMANAKKLLGNTICIGGNVPSGLILTGTAEQVKAYCKNLIDVAGKDGGYIMSFGTSMDEGKPDTIHAMIDFTKEYGVYK